MNISDALIYLAKLKDDDEYNPQLLAIVLLARGLVNEGVQFDWDHISHQAETER
jgi:hypothetical protein